MKLIKTFDPLKSLFTYLTGALVIGLLFIVVPINYYFNSPIIIFIIVLTTLDIYFHENLHKLGGLLIGVESIVNLKNFPPTCTPCTPSRPLNYKELFTFSIFPIFISLIYFVLTIIFYFFSSVFFFKLFSFMGILSLSGLLGDFGYIFAAFKYKDRGLFLDKGKFLEIYEDEGKMC